MNNQNVEIPVDLAAIIAKYDTAAINKSPIKYYKAVLSVTNEMINLLQDYENAQDEIISEISKITQEISENYTIKKYLTKDENALLEERQKILARRFTVNTNDAKEEILSVKVQADELAARIYEANHFKNSLIELEKIENAPRVSFEFLTENLAEIILDAQSKINFFVENKHFVTAVVENLMDWNDDYNYFRLNSRGKLEQVCKKHHIYIENYNKWYDDWQKVRFAIEKKFLPLIEFGLERNLGDLAIEVLEILTEYKVDVDNFYLNERHIIYQKISAQKGNELQEKFATESELYKVTEDFQRNLQEVIFECNKIEDRAFLMHWAEPLFNFSMNEIMAFIEDRNINIPVEIYNQFNDLRRHSLLAYLGDSRDYSAIIEEREKDFNDLLFKMQKHILRK